jgi:iron complex transport system substrate-binding protein
MSSMFMVFSSRRARSLLVGLILAGMLLGGGPPEAVADIRLRDDAGREVRLAEPARRIVSLAPHLAELAHAAGAGRALVGVSAYSDYPAAVQNLPRVGSGQGLDIERILALRPDLVLAWHSGNPSRALQRLEALGLVVYRSEPADLAAIATGLEQIGRLAGTGVEARRAAEDFRAGLAALQERYGTRRPVRLFYQLWHQPLMTVGGQHWLNDALRLCGAVNVFADQPEQVLTLDLEAVLARDPELLVVAGAGEEPGAGLDLWQAWPSLGAVARGQVHWLPADRLHRPTPRILEGIEILCRQVDAARGIR